MKLAAAIVLRSVFASTSLRAQAISQINGTIRASNGLAVPSAKVKAKQTVTSAVRTTLSGANGTYVLPDLPISPYLLEMTKRSFRKFAQTRIDAQRSPRCLSMSKPLELALVARPASGTPMYLARAWFLCGGQPGKHH